MTSFIGLKANRETITHSITFQAQFLLYKYQYLNVPWYTKVFIVFYKKTVSLGHKTSGHTTLLPFLMTFMTFERTFLTCKLLYVLWIGLMCYQNHLFKLDENFDYQYEIWAGSFHGLLIFWNTTLCFTYSS